MESVTNFLYNLPHLVKFALLIACIYSFPKLAERVRLPGMIGLLLIGIILGPNGLGVLGKNAPVIEEFSNIGKLLLMFFVGFEVDFDEFNQARNKAYVFGIITFLFPFLTGLVIAVAFDYNWNASVLIGSILASHTLIAFSIVKKLGLLTAESTIVTIGATLVSDIMAMFILAVCLPIHMSGFSLKALVINVVELIIFIPFMLFAFSWITGHFFKRYADSKEANLLILLLLISLAALLAELIHLEGIVGAFLAGLAVKKVMQHKKIADTLDVLSQTLFIPAFFIVTGFLIDFSAMGNTIALHPLLVLGIAGGLFGGKFLAAQAATSLYHYSPTERNLMWSLTLPQVASTLASTVVAYETINSAGERLVDEAILNSVLVLVILTSILGPVLTNYFGKRFDAI